MELILVVIAIVIGLFFLKLLFTILGVAVQIVLLPFKILFGIILFALALPFLILLLPFFLLAGVGLLVGGIVIGTLCLLAFVL